MSDDGKLNIPVWAWFIYITILITIILICCLIEANVIEDVPLPNYALIGIILPSFILGWHTCAFIKYGESRKLDPSFRPDGFSNMHMPNFSNMHIPNFFPQRQQPIGYVTP